MVPVESTVETFQHLRVLGKAAITDATTRLRLVESLKDGIAHNDGRQAKCFNPRHALQATRKGKSVDLLICFECHGLEVIIDSTRQFSVLGPTPEKTFEAARIAAGLPAPPRSPEIPSATAP